MKGDLEAKRITTEQLRDLADKELLSKYGAKFAARRTTCRQARDKALTEFDGISSNVK